MSSIKNAKRIPVQRTAVRSAERGKASAQNTSVNNAKRNDVVRGVAAKAVPQKAAAMRAPLRRAQKAVGSDGRIVTTNM